MKKAATGKVYFWTYRVVTRSLFLYLLPLCLVGVLNSLVVRALLRSAAFRRRQGNAIQASAPLTQRHWWQWCRNDTTNPVVLARHRRRRSDDDVWRITIMCCATCLSFLCCYLPGCIRELLSNLDYEGYLCYTEVNESKLKLNRNCISNEYYTMQMKFYIFPPYQH